MPLAESIFQQKPCHQDLCKIEIVTKRFSGQICGLAFAKWDSTQQSLLYKIIILTANLSEKVLNFKVQEFLDCLYFVVFFLLHYLGEVFIDCWRAALLVNLSVGI